MAAPVTGRRKVLSMYRSYHGTTTDRDLAHRRPAPLGERAATTAPCASSVPTCTARRSTPRRPEQESERALAHLEQTILLEGAPTIAAIIIETIVGTNGVLVPPPGYLQGVRELCDRYGIVYIADEVMVGFGRLGEWFGVDAFDGAARPDHLREGRQLGLRPARRRRDLGSRSPRISTPCRSPAG